MPRALTLPPHAPSCSLPKSRLGRAPSSSSRASLLKMKRVHCRSAPTKRLESNRLATAQEAVPLRRNLSIAACDHTKPLLPSRLLPSRLPMAHPSP